MRAFLLVALLLLPAISFADLNVPSLMGQAQQAYLGGDYTTAKELFGEVLEMDPHNTLAINYLRKIRALQGSPTPAASDLFSKLILPKVELKDAAFSAALDFFKHEAAVQSVNVSFVAQLPAAQMERPVTLSLSQIPFLTALKYLCDLNGAAYKVEPYAIVIVPAGAQ